MLRIGRPNEADIAAEDGAQKVLGGEANAGELLELNKNNHVQNQSMCPLSNQDVNMSLIFSERMTCTNIRKQKGDFESNMQVDVKYCHKHERQASMV